MTIASLVGRVVKLNARNEHGYPAHYWGGLREGYSKRSSLLERG